MKKKATDITTNSIKFITLIIMLMLALASGMYFYVQRSIHKERVVHLEVQTETTRNLINKTIEQYSKYADICEGLVGDQLYHGENVYTFLDEMGSLLYLKDANLILIDSNCNWYSGVNHSGRINEVDKYTSDTREQEIYITEEVFSGKECIVYRNRLDEPIEVKTDTGTATIEYCGVICYFDDMTSEFSVAFPYTCNKFVTNSQGGMLYKDFGMNKLMGGSNVFAKYDRVNFKFGDNAEELLERIEKGDTTVAEFAIDGENYFICTSRLRYNHWYVSYVIDSSEIASGSYVKVVVIFILGMCLVFMIALGIGGYSAVNMRLAQQEAENEKRENEILAQVAKSKSDFLSNMSHDIRTPINGIMGMTTLAMRERDSDRVIEYLKKIDRTSDHLLSLVNDVLDMSSIESGKITINTRPVDMKLIPADCVSILQSQADENKLEIVTEFAELEHTMYVADELKLRQIIINILSNAIKYTPAGGKIYFRVSEESCENGVADLKFEIEDTGIGMSADFLEHIWESFSQEAGGSRTHFKGTGLGMAITKNFVDLMGGTITVESELDKGSKFTVVLPIELLPDRLKIAEESEEEKNLHELKILLVEDNEINIEIAYEILSDEGARVVLAYDGTEAVEAFAASDVGEYDVILMDVMMPLMSGTEASKAIRAMDREDAKTIPIIAMTANAYEDDIKATQDAGMNAHITKPLNIDLLLKTICRLCSR